MRRFKFDPAPRGEIITALKDPKPHDNEVPLSSGYWDDPELERLWVEEAERRYQEILDGKVKAISAEEAVRRARAALHEN